MQHKDYSGAIQWQFEHGVSPALTAHLFNKAVRSIPVIAWRSAHGFIPSKVEKVINEAGSAGINADRLLAGAEIEEIDCEGASNSSDLEAQIDAFGRNFWRKVKDRRGVKELGLLLRRVSRPSWENIPLRRAAIHLYHLLSETHLHAGFCRSALAFATKAYRAESQLYKETLSRNELFRIAKTSLLISQAFINRSEYDNALPWIRRSEKAFLAGSHMVDPEHHKQLATVQFHGGAILEATKNYKLAGSLLASFNPSATKAEVKDIGQRHLNLIGRHLNWERAFELMEFALENFPKDDIHKALNVNWAAAAGLMTDSSEANKKAIDLLYHLGHLSKGYQHPETVTELLLMAAELPQAIRPEWVRFSLHYNAFRNK